MPIGGHGPRGVRVLPPLRDVPRWARCRALLVRAVHLYRKGIERMGSGYWVSSESASYHSLPEGWYHFRAPRGRPAQPELLIPAGILVLGDKVDEGQLIESVALPWFEIIKEWGRNPLFLQQLPWRKVEELIAGAYRREGWPEVILTPRSGDGGRDIIASKPGVGAV